MKKSLLSLQLPASVQCMLTQPKFLTCPRDISRSPDEGAVQDQYINFSKSHGRRFALEWYKKYPWLGYSACEDKVSRKNALVQVKRTTDSQSTKNPYCTKTAPPETNDHR